MSVAPTQPAFTAPRQDILEKVGRLLRLYRKGKLGGAEMPEDSNPGLPGDSRENFHYFTLPMALNYQRNSYALWRSALATWEDTNTRFVFMPEKVCRKPERDLAEALLKYKLALQPARHPAIWRTIAQTLVNTYEGDVRVLFRRCNDDISVIKREVQEKEKRGFPYLSGPKICNYWLYVLGQYTGASFKNRGSLSVAPDTHVIKASIALGLVPDMPGQEATLRLGTAAAWTDLLAGTGLDPIDVHTPLWLWSRNGLHPEI